MYPTYEQPQYIRQMVTTIKVKIDRNKIIMGEFNTPLKTIQRSSRQKINTETQTLNDTLDHMNVVDIYRTFHTKIVKCTFFSSAHRAFSWIDHVIKSQIKLW